MMSKEAQSKQEHKITSLGLTKTGDGYQNNLTITSTASPFTLARHMAACNNHYQFRILRVGPLIG